MAPGSTVVRNVLKRLRERREELELSQAQVAEAIGVNPSYIGLLERGERMPSLDVLVQFSEAVGMELSDLFGGAKPKTSAAAEPELAVIRGMLVRWPARHRRSAVRVIAEMDKIVSAEPRRRKHRESSSER